uniref:4'-phosphopantetheine phosphatase n=1 Tax=Plectus sambesii TaxID=2011161 RepID=A0A914VQP2_9BILA
MPGGSSSEKDRSAAQETSSSSSDEMAASGSVRSIVLPCDEVFRNLKNAKRFAIDIGGSLAKLAYSSTVVNERKTAPKTKLLTNETRAHSTGLAEMARESNVEGMRLHFIKFETKYIESCLEFIQQKLDQSGLASSSKAVKCTGGGAYKYFDLVSSKLRLEVHKEDEMECLIKGCNFLLRNIPDESFTYHHHDELNKYHFQTVDPISVFPYLLVNIGTGVSIVKVEGDTEFDRVGGSTLGGGSFFGLGSLLTDAKGFDDLLRMAEEGDHRNVDLLVSDVYGGAYQKLGLPSDLIAGSFGKTIQYSNAGPEDHKTPPADADKARSLLLMISNCIGQIAVLYARMHKLNRIYFGGYFIRNHHITMRTISYAIDYWSQGEIQALFLRHEGYLGAIGAFLKGAEEDNMSSLYSWNEHYAGCSGLGRYVPTAFLSQNVNINVLEMECAKKNLMPFPLLANAATYRPDTVDLTQDDEARAYWIQCLERGVDKTVKKAIESQPDSDDAAERANNFQHRYLQHLKLLRQKPFAYGCLNVRSLLDLNEQLLNEFYFKDAYQLQKYAENEAALNELGEVLKIIDSLEWEDRQLALVKGLLAGNVFDWGAQEVVKLMEREGGLSFASALEKLQPRPWLNDSFESWVESLRKRTHKCAVIFADNSGADVLLGVIPFARELIQRGTKVIIAANASPALNDITRDELVELCVKVAEIDPAILGKALSSGMLLIMDNGQGSPCLDLSRIDGSLRAAIIEHEVDLVVLEGMGRALHTNFDAEFSCESLKAAVVKNLWLANRLGGEIFSVIFKHELPQSNGL